MTRRRASGWTSTPASAQSAVMAAVRAMPSAVLLIPATLGSSAKAITGAAKAHGAIGATTVRKRPLRIAGHGRRRGCALAPGATVSGALRSSMSTPSIKAMWGR